MWTPEHRRAAERSGLRYPSNLTDAEWAIVEPMIPPARHGGRGESPDHATAGAREILALGLRGKDGFTRHGTFRSISG